MTNKINLGKEVIVTDPCYTIPTWCQKIVDNVLPGEYHVFVKKYDCEGWGVRNSMLTAIHKDYVGKKLKWSEEGPRGIIGVDSGQAGIFNITTYRKDDEDVPLGDGDIAFLSQFPTDNEGDKWYTKICSHTLGGKNWGHYENGVVCTSGLGDGGYDLFVAQNRNKKVVGFTVDFGIEDDDIINFDWFKNTPAKTIG